ncbi:Uncharacterized protein FKW44_023964, partial [Caligus rogercresseyi]
MDFVPLRSLGKTLLSSYFMSLPLETKHALDIINASLVSLGVAEDPQLISAGPFSLIPKTVVAKSLGFGFVRSVDRVKECFYLLTSLRGPALSSVNVLSCGAIFLPEDCYK